MWQHSPWRIELLFRVGERYSLDPGCSCKMEACILPPKNALYVSRHVAMGGTTKQIIVIGQMPHTTSQLQLSLEASCRLEVRSQRCDRCLSFHDRPTVPTRSSFPGTLHYISEARCPFEMPVRPFPAPR